MSTEKELTQRTLSEEELKSLTEDLQAVLEKHGATLGVSSTINLMKVVEKNDDESTSSGDESTDTEAN